MGTDDRGGRQPAHRGNGSLGLAEYVRRLMLAYRARLAAADKARQDRAAPSALHDVRGAGAPGEAEEPAEDARDH